MFSALAARTMGPGAPMNYTTFAVLSAGFRGRLQPANYACALSWLGARLFGNANFELGRGGSLLVNMGIALNGIDRFLDSLYDCKLF